MKCVASNGISTLHKVVWKTNNSPKNIVLQRFTGQPANQPGVPSLMRVLLLQCVPDFDYTTADLYPVNAVVLSMLFNN